MVKNIAALFSYRALFLVTVKKWGMAIGLVRAPHTRVWLALLKELSES